MSNGVYTFYPDFSQYVVLYRGVTAVWIGNGNSSSPSNPDYPAFNDQGVLYASYIDNSVQNLGPVSSFAEAVASGKAGPNTDFPTEADWIQHIVDTTQNAQDALDGAAASEQSAGDSESWAVGTRGGTTDTERENAATNNSKYWSEQSSDYADAAQSYAEAADDSADDAADSAAEAKQWANWNVVGSPSATNNAKTYSENSKESSLQAESWADGTRNGQDDTQRQGATTNNAHYWSEQSKAWATTKTEDNAKYYSEVAGAHATNASTSEQNAKKWVNWNTEGEPSAVNNAKAYSDSASNSASSSEAWANGTRSGIIISSTDEAYNKHSKYWAGQASQSSVSASGYADNAEASALKAARWTNGTGSGTPGAENNAEYFAEIASEKADSIRNPVMTVEYQSSKRATVVPTGEWVTTREPVKGEYLWIRFTLTWYDGASSVFYIVSYQGLDGTGAVLSVNGETGEIVLDGNNIYVNSEASVPQTITAALAGKVDSIDFISDSQIDDLFGG